MTKKQMEQLRKDGEARRNQEMQGIVRQVGSALKSDEFRRTIDPFVTDDLAKHAMRLISAYEKPKAVAARAYAIADAMMAERRRRSKR
jgi:hypothetical protein